MYKAFLFVCFSMLLNWGSLLSNGIKDSLLNELNLPIHDTTRVRLLNELAVLSFNDSVTAFKYCREALSISDKIGFVEGQALSTYYIGSTHLTNRNYQKAIKYYKEALKPFRIEQNYFRLIKTHLNIGAASFYLGLKDSSILHFEQSMTYCRQLKDTTLLLMNLENLATMYHGKNEEYKALQCIDEALVIREKEMYKSGIANLLLVQGNVLQAMGDLSNALITFQKGLDLSEEQCDSAMLAQFTYNIGFIHDKLKNNEKARIYIERALEINTQLKNDYRRILCLNALSVVFANLDEDELALESLLKAEQLANIIDNDLKKGDVQYSMGDFYYNKNDFKKALIHYSNALEIRERLNLMPGMASCYANIAKAYKALNKYELALNNAVLAYEIRRRNSRKDQLIGSLKQLATIHSLLENYQKAYDFHVEYKSLQDSVFSDDNIKKLTSLEMQYIHDKEKEIALIEKKVSDELHLAELNKQKIVRYYLFAGILLLFTLVVLLNYHNREKRKSNQKLIEKNKLIENKNEEIRVQKENVLVQNEELKALVKTRDTYISVLAHDLNNLVGGSIQMIELIENKCCTSDTKEKFIEQIFDNSKQTYSLLTHIIRWGKAISRNEKMMLENINLQTSIEHNRLLYKVQAKLKGLVINNFCPAKLEVWVDPNMLDVVMRNLIQNAIKYTTKGGSISIDTSVNKGFVQVSVVDTGIGMSKEKLKKLFAIGDVKSEIGTAGEKGTGLGLQITKEYIEAQGGKIWVESDLGVGTVIRFTIPVVNVVE